MKKRLLRTTAILAFMLISFIVQLVNAQQVLTGIDGVGSIIDPYIITDFPTTLSNVNSKDNGYSASGMNGSCSTLPCCSVMVAKVITPEYGSLRADNHNFQALSASIIGYVPNNENVTTWADLDFLNTPGNFCGFRDSLELGYYCHWPSKAWQDDADINNTSHVLPPGEYYILFWSYNNQAGIGPSVADFTFDFAPFCPLGFSCYSNTETICEGDIWVSPSGNEYSISGNYTDTLGVAVDGSDSLIRTTLVVRPPSESTDTKTACFSHTWIDGETYTESNTTATYTLQDIYGCDSIISLDLTIENFITTQDTLKDVTVCENDQINLEAYTNKSSFGQFKYSNKRWIEVNELRDSIAGTNRSVFMWMKHEAKVPSNNNRVLFAINKSNGDNISWMYIRSTEELAIYDGEDRRETNIVVTDGKWHHVGYTYNETTNYTKIYIDGKVVKTFSDNQVVTSTSQISIGQEFDGSSKSDFFDGEMAEVSIWNTILTDEEIKLIMDASVEDDHPQRNKLKLYYPFIAQCGEDHSIVKDYSGNEFDGTVSSTSGDIQATDTTAIIPDFDATDQYQVNWLKGSTSVSSDKTLILNGNLSDAGAYQLKLKKGIINITDHFTYTVTPPPVFIQQPINDTTGFGTTAIFEADVSGSDLSYIWRELKYYFKEYEVVNGLADESCNSVYVFDSKTYVATSNGLSISVDVPYFNGDDDTYFESVLIGEVCNGVFVDESGIYVATEDGLQISTNGGENFSKHTTGLPSIFCYDVFREGDSLFVGTKLGVSLSSNGGNSFNDIFDPFYDDAERILVYEDIIYVASNYGLLISSDWGANYDIIDTENGLGRDWAYDVFVKNDTILVGTPGGISISVDGGNSFVNKTDAENGLRDDQCYSVYLDNGTIYAGTDGGLCYSIDGGETFKSDIEGLRPRKTNEIFKANGVLYAAISGGVLESADFYDYSADSESMFTINNVNAEDTLRSFTLKVINEITGCYNFSDTVRYVEGCSFINDTIIVESCLTYTTPHGNRLITEPGTYTDTIVDANNCEDYYTYIVTLNPLPTITSQPVDRTLPPESDADFEVQTSNGTYDYQWAKFDWGYTQSYLGVAAPGDVYDVTIVNDVIYTCTRYQGLFISTDNGETFTQKSVADGLGHVSCYSVFVSNDTVMVGTANGISISVDGANTFTNTNLGSNAFNYCYRVKKIGSTIYVATKDGVYRSDNDGASYDYIPITYAWLTQTIDAICYDIHKKGDKTYIATDQGVAVSDDDLASFTLIDVTGDSFEKCFKIIENNNNIIYFATNKGIGRSTDNGQNYDVCFPANSDCKGLSAQGNTICATFSGTQSGSGYRGLYVSYDQGETFEEEVLTTEGVNSSTKFYCIHVEPDGGRYLGSYGLVLPTRYEYSIIEGDTNSSVILSNINESMHENKYLVHITNQITGCTTTSDTVMLNVVDCIPSSSTDVRTETSPYTWIDGMVYIEDNNTATHILTNVEGCDSTITLNLTIQSLLSVEITLDSLPSCNGFYNGGLTSLGSGGTPPYTYEWSNSATTATIAGIGAGNYTVTITDATSATATDPYTVTEPSALSLSFTERIDENVTGFHIECNGGYQGGINTTVSGGVPYYTYQWSNGATASSLHGITAGSYTVTATDMTGCEITDSQIITENAAITGLDTRLEFAPYTWIDGITYTEDNNTATYTLTNAIGCDSIVSLNLTIGSSFTVSETELTVDEDESAQTFTVVLNNEPSSNVVISLISNDTDEAIVSPAALTFTTENWNSEQTVTTTGVNDDLVDGTQTAIITVSIVDALSDDDFDDLTDETVTVNNEDNDTPDFTVSKSTLTVSENENSQTFTVILDTKPATDVVIDLSSGDTDEATVAPETVTFTSENWNSAQTITVSGVNDDLIDGTQTAIITLSINDASSEDSFDSLEDKTVNVSVEDNDTPGFLLSASALTVSESGNTEFFTIVLNAKPSSDVVINLVSDATDEATISPASLTFTTDNWNSEQTITVKGIDDDLVDGTQTAIITASVDDAASDDDFDALENKTVTLSVEDNDTPSYTVSENELQLSENEDSKTFTIILNSQPSSNVVFNITSDATDEALVSPANVTFTTSNWNSEQTITVTGVNDDLVDGTQIATVSVSVDDANSDDNYDALEDKSVNISVTDNDTPGFEVSETELIVSENLTMKTFTLVLNAEPSSDVVFNIASNATDEAMVSPATISFTSSNWNAEQTLTVTGVNDDLVDGTQNARINVTIDAANSDDDYDNLTYKSVDIVIEDNDTPGFELSETNLTVSENLTTASFTVVLSAGPLNDVLFNIGSNAVDEAVVSPATLTFTTNNWNSPQTVIITGVEDVLVDGTQTAYITTAVNDASSDDSFDNLTDKKVTISIEDNDTPGFELSKSSVNVDESGSAEEFTAVLTASPSSDVVFDLSSNDTGEASVFPTTFTFTTNNWNSPQTATVTGINDLLIDGVQNAIISVAVNAASSDNYFDNLTQQTVTASVEDDDTPGFTVSETSLNLNEGGSTRTFTVVLEARPSSDVLFDISSNATDEATVSSSSITFTNADWDVAQSITINPIDDDLVDGTQTATIKVSVNDAASNDNFDNLSDKTVIATVEDNDTPGFSVSETTLTVDESGSSQSFNVVLDAQPDSPVILLVSSNATDEATVGSASLTFDSSNWSDTQSVDVTGIDDAVVDGTQTAMITIAVDDAASDDNFDNLSNKNLTIEVEDNDTPGFTVSETSLEVDESGTSKTFTVVLDAQAVSDVVFNIVSNATDEVSVSPATLTFKNGDWDIEQTVTVSGVDDIIVDGTQNAMITIAVNAALSDDNFDNLSNKVVNVTNGDNDNPVSVAITSVQHVSCNGESNGSLTATVTPGTSNYDYVWNNGTSSLNSALTSNTINDLPAGSYTITVTDDLGTSDNATITITEPQALDVNITVDSNVTCNGYANGGLTATVNGGDTPSYLWSNSATTASITGVTAGSYSVLVTDANGCTFTNNGIVTQPSNLLASTVVDSNATCNAYANGGMTTSATGGTTPYSYTWSNSATTATIAGVIAGTYSVTITDANGCTSTSSKTVTEPVILVASTVIDSNATCNAYANGGMTASATGGTTPYSYAWSNSATTASIAGIIAGTYSVTITDANGCTSTSSKTVTEPAILVASTVVDSNATCNGYANGGVTASATGGTTPYSYAWSNSATTATITGVIAGTYSVTITDANGCTSTSSKTVTEPVILVASTVIDSNATCNGYANGGATASATGGTGAYSYSWSNSATTASITGVIAGTYSVTITDANGCTASESVTITESTVLIASTMVDDHVTCNGYSDGGATASASGGTEAYTYAWSNSATTANITGVIAGTYTVTITDANGCSDTESVTITEPAILVASTMVDNHVTCNGYANGGATASATGGTGAYTYLWSNSASTASITGVIAGTYTVTITDSNGCIDTETVTITEPAILLASTMVDDHVSCNGYANGGATASAIGGTEAYTYAWSNSATTASITGVNAGTYIVTITDANGCTDTESVTITEPEALVITDVITSNITGCESDENAIITVTANGGTSAYLYSIDNTNTWQASNVFEDLAVGDYDIYVKDANDCISGWGTTISVNEPAPIIITLDEITNVDCNGNNTGAIHMTVSGGIPDFVFEWLGPNGFTADTESINGLFPGDYVLTVTDANACVEISGPHTITEPATALAINEVLSTNADGCFGNNNGSIEILAQGGTPEYLYSINNGANFYPSPVFYGLGAGDYEIIVKDANGCETIWTDVVVITGPATIEVVGVDVVNVTGCSGFDNGEMHINAIGGTGTLRYSINGGYNYYTNGGDFYGVTAGTYEIRIKDASPCFYTHSTLVNVTEPQLLEVVDVQLTDVSICYGNTNGMIEITANGGTGTTTYSIDGGSTYIDNGGIFDNLGAGTYDVYIMDDNGCISEYTNNLVVLNEPNPMTILVTSSDVNTCHGGDNGMISINVTGSTADYSYSIDGGTTWLSSGSFTDLIAGDYEIVIEDANGCMQDYSGNPVVIGEPTLIEFGDVAVINAGCFGASDGEIMISETGGTGMLMFSVDGGASYQESEVFTGLAAGDYMLMIMDANGCEMAYENNPVVVEDGAEIVIEEVIVTNVQCSGELGSITIIASGGIGDLMYSINGGTDYYETNVFTDLISDTYIVRVRDANMCNVLYDGNPIVIENPQSSPITITVNPENGPYCVNELVALEAIADDAVSFIWQPGSLADPIIEVTSGVVQTVEYTVTVINAAGCESMASVEIEYDICESLPELESNMMTIHVYPNPSNGEFSLKLTGVSQEVEISVLDFAGRLVLEDKMLEIAADKMEKQFDFSDYERGVYFLRITHGEMVSYKKVVIQ